MTCAFTHTGDPLPLRSEEAKGCWLWQEKSAMSALKLGDRLWGFLSRVAPLRRRMEETDIAGPHLPAGEAPPNPLPPENPGPDTPPGSWWLLGLGSGKHGPPASPDTWRTKGRREQRSTIPSPREAGGEPAPGPPSGASGAGLEFPRLRRTGPNQGEALCLAPGISEVPWGSPQAL